MNKQIFGIYVLFSLTDDLKSVILIAGLVWRIFCDPDADAKRKGYGREAGKDDGSSGTGFVP